MSQVLWAVPASEFADLRPLIRRYEQALEAAFKGEAGALSAAEAELGAAVSATGRQVLTLDDPTYLAWRRARKALRLEKPVRYQAVAGFLNAIGYAPADVRAVMEEFKDASADLAPLLGQFGMALERGDGLVFLAD